MSQLEQRSSSLSSSHVHSFSLIDEEKNHQAFSSSSIVESLECYEGRLMLELVNGYDQQNFGSQRNNENWKYILHPFTLYLKYSDYSNYCPEMNIDLLNTCIEFGRCFQVHGNEWTNYLDLQLACYIHPCDSNTDDDNFERFYFDPQKDIPENCFVSLSDIISQNDDDDDDDHFTIRQYIEKQQEQATGKKLSIYLSCNYRIKLNKNIIKEKNFQVIMLSSLNSPLLDVSLSENIEIYNENNFIERFGRVAIVLPKRADLFYDVYCSNDATTFDLLNANTEWRQADSLKSDQHWIFISPQLERSRDYLFKVICVQKENTWIQYPVLKCSQQSRIIEEKVMRVAISDYNEDIQNASALAQCHLKLIEFHNLNPSLFKSLKVNSNPLFHIDVSLTSIGSSNLDDISNTSTSNYLFITERIARVDQHDVSKWKEIPPLTSLENTEDMKNLEINPKLDYMVRFYCASQFDRHRVLRSPNSSSKAIPSSLVMWKELAACGELSKTYDTTIRVMTRTPVFFVFLTGFSSRFPNEQYYHYKVEAKRKDLPNEQWFSLNCELVPSKVCKDILLIRNVPLTYVCKISPRSNELMAYGKTYTIRISCVNPISGNQAIVKEFSKTISNFNYCPHQATEILERNGGMLAFHHPIVTMYLFLNGDMLCYKSVTLNTIEERILEGRFKLTNLISRSEYEKIFNSSSFSTTSVTESTKTTIAHIETVFMHRPKNAPHLPKQIYEYTFKIVFNHWTKCYELLDSSELFVNAQDVMMTDEDNTEKNILYLQHYQLDPALAQRNMCGLNALWEHPHRAIQWFPILEIHRVLQFHDVEFTFQ
ncbi:hypothetical protein C9374_011469 [Naegleria lovaniensis]|uniref:Uncharacterized protein n=1 Tax=Naegleria lovaniensis TaxID=51637 RepID=A0AA88GY66_NAELO|nr:uncharacterized protein C9374_011469 [Naegleria lovaniensis]KAG2392744.1 hypothetical protein C9374_011469 [Naegleria lovaniensis]